MNAEEYKKMSFSARVLYVTQQIPKGRVTTYGAIANWAGSPASSRMVGWILHSTRNSIDIIPAHRVVNRNGILTGKKHFGTPDTMKQLLENENIIIENDTVIDFSRLFWDPVKEINF